MALPTFLSLVNDVLVRLREPTVSTVAENTLSTLVGKFVNDSKREVADAYDWDAFNTSVTVTTAASQYTGYTLTGAGTRFRVTNVLDITDYGVLLPTTVDKIERRVYSTASPQNADPSEYAFNGVDSNGDSQVMLWPIPVGVNSIRFSLVVPESDMSADADTTKLPKEPIVLAALARAFVERGEDGGLSSSECYALAKKALADVIAIELARSPENDAWVPA
jgi:hypothetical protein